jgi:hypothetical protein
MTCRTKAGATCAFKRTVRPVGPTTSAAQADPSNELSGRVWKLGCRVRLWRRNAALCSQLRKAWYFSPRSRAKAATDKPLRLKAAMCCWIC